MEFEVVRGGKPKWKKEFSKLSVHSAPLFKKLFGPKYKRILEGIYLKDKRNLFSRHFAYLAMVDEKPAGLLIAYRHKDGQGKFFSMGKDFLFTMGPGRFVLQAPWILSLRKNMAKTEPKQSYLCNFAVYPKHRSKGLGTALFERAIEDAKKAGQEFLILDVETDNEKAIRLYKRLGFKKYSHRYTVKVRGMPVDFFRMKKEL